MVRCAGSVIAGESTRGIVKGPIVSLWSDFQQRHTLQAGNWRRKLRHVRGIKWRHIRRFPFGKEVEETLPIKTNDVREHVRLRTGLKEQHVAWHPRERQLIGQRDDARKW